MKANGKTISKMERGFSSIKKVFILVIFKIFSNMDMVKKNSQMEISTRVSTKMANLRGKAFTNGILA